MLTPKQIKDFQKKLKCVTCDISELEDRVTDLEANYPLVTLYVDYYADLPDPTTVPNSTYGVVNSQGSSFWPGWIGGTFYPKGIYHSDGVSWIYMGEFPYQATLADVNAGIITNQFVSPYTFENASKWATHTHAGLYVWSEIVALTHNMQVNEAYVANNALQVVFTLPATASIGDSVKVVGKGVGGWSITQNAGQQIFFGNQQTTIGVTGGVVSNHYGDTISIVCITANNEWRVDTAVSNAIIIN